MRLLNPRRPKGGVEGHSHRWGDHFDRHRSPRSLSVRRHSVEPLEERTLLSMGGLGDRQAFSLPPRVDLHEPGGYLTGPSTGEPLDIAMAYLTSHAGSLGLLLADLSHSIVTDQYASPDTAVTHIYLRQELNGLEVVNADMNVNVTADGRILSVGDGFVPGLSLLENATPAAPSRATSVQKHLVAFAPAAHYWRNLSYLPSSVEIPQGELQTHCTCRRRPPVRASFVNRQNPASLPLQGD